METPFPGRRAYWRVPGRRCRGSARRSPRCSTPASPNAPSSAATCPGVATPIVSPSDSCEHPMPSSRIPAARPGKSGPALPTGRRSTWTGTRGPPGPRRGPAARPARTWRTARLASCRGCAWRRSRWRWRRPRWNRRRPEGTVEAALIGYQDGVGDSRAPVEPGHQLAGVGQLRDPLRVDEARRLDDPQARTRQPVHELRLVSTINGRLLVLQPVPRAHLPDRDPARQRAPWRSRDRRGQPTSRTLIAGPSY